MIQQSDSEATLARIDEARATLIRLVRTVDSRRLARRPPSGKWSPIENVRHLLFAEQSHLGRFLKDGVTWSAFGLPPHNMAGQKQLRVVGTRPTTNLDEVLDAWASVHESVRARCAEGPSDLEKALQRNLIHLTRHLKTIERLLRE